MTDLAGDAQLDRALQLGIEKCIQDARRLQAFPHVTRDGEWLTSGHGRWTAGFFIGQIWLAYMITNNEGAKELASDWSRRLEARAKDRSTHDMGFLFEPSFVRGFNVTGDGRLRDHAIQAAYSLATRYHPEGRYIQAWSEEEDPAHAGLAIVDTIMNLPILLWAYEQTGDKSLQEVGVAAAETIAGQHIRADGSTFHVVTHDPKTGVVTDKGTHQGASPSSCWTRGQAWAIYGFARMGAILRAQKLVDTAGRLADYFVARLDGDYLPPWDFDRSQADEPRDSAAGAIAASGLLELGRVSGEPRYTQAGYRIAVGLAYNCVDYQNPTRPGLLLHGSVDVPRRSGIDQSIVYGDHYFLEAIVKIRRPELWNRLGCPRYDSQM